MAASRITSITELITINNTAQNLYVGITADVQTYYHTIVVTLGNQTVTQDISVAGSSYPVISIPPTILNGMTTSATGTANVTLRTYTDSTRATLVGTTTSSFTIRCTASPTIGSFTAAVGTNSQAYAVGITDKYIMGYSTCLLTASNVSAKYGATIASYRFYSYNYANTWSEAVTSSASSASIESPEIPIPFEINFRVDVTDSRGLTSTRVVSVQGQSLYDIGWAITLSNTEIFRCNSSGVADDNGTYISVKTTATASPSQNSVQELFFMTRETGEGDYSGKTTLTSGTATIKSGFDVDRSYDIVIHSVDAFDRDEWLYVTTIYGALITMDFKEGGKGIAVGKVADNEEQVDSAWDIKTDGNIILDSNEVLTDVNGKPSVKFTDIHDDTYAEIIAPTVSSSFEFWRYGQTYDSSTGTTYVDNSQSEVYRLPYYDVVGEKWYTILTTKGTEVFSGTCSTAAGTTLKYVEIDQYIDIHAGVVVFVKFDNTNTAAVANLKLGVNDPYNGKPIKVLSNGAIGNLPSAGYLVGGQTYMFAYDGTNWVTPRTATSDNYKPIQTAVASPTASGTGIAYIATISQDANGVITATKSTVRSASASQSGVVTTGNQTFAGTKTFSSTISGSINGNAATATTASSCTGNSATATTATTMSYPLGFASRTANPTWGDQTGTGITSWNESDGGAIQFRKNNPSSGNLSAIIDGRYYFAGGKIPAAGLKSANSYWGMTDPDGADNVWIRTTSAGIIPYQSGGSGSGHQSLGTSSWRFSAAYIDDIYGYLHGNISGSSASCTGNAATATSATSATTASKLGSSNVGTAMRPIYLSAGTATACRVPASLYSGTLSSGSATLTNAFNYNYIIVMGIPGVSGWTTKTSVTIPTALITTTASRWGIANESYGIAFTLTKSSNNITLTWAAGSGSITNVYGGI